MPVITYTEVKKDKDKFTIEYCYYDDPSLTYIRVYNQDRSFDEKFMLGSWVFTHYKKGPTMKIIYYQKITGFTKKYFKCGDKRYRVESGEKLVLPYRYPKIKINGESKSSQDSIKFGDRSLNFSQYLDKVVQGKIKSDLAKKYQIINEQKVFYQMNLI